MKIIGADKILIKSSGYLISSDIDFESIDKEKINRICICSLEAVLKLIVYIFIKYNTIFRVTFKSKYQENK